MSPSFEGSWGLAVGRSGVLLPLGARMRMSASKVELYAAIRRDHRAGLSMRALERKYGVTWRTIRRALGSHWPEPRKQQAPRLSRLDPYKPVIDGMLEADLDAPAKPKHTVKRIVDRLTFGGNIIETGTDSYRLAPDQSTGRSGLSTRTEDHHDRPGPHTSGR